MSGFNFESDLLPLAASLSEPVGLPSGNISENKRIGLVKGIALCVGLQVSLYALLLIFIPTETPCPKIGSGIL